ncbi:hypothetical protein VKT23_019726 [Stygiomarasmius scandens]|uniref:Uncharacterized protein n=1 Tax=Marasmiellus scandens TaxID=2682957 RepID=A0ABR1INI3_9AGAR
MRLLNQYCSSVPSVSSRSDSNLADSTDSDIVDRLLVLNHVDLGSIQQRLENILLGANRLKDILQIADVAEQDMIQTADESSSTSTIHGDALFESESMRLSTEVEMIILRIILDTYDLQNLLSVGRLGNILDGMNEDTVREDRD